MVNHFVVLIIHRYFRNVSNIVIVFLIIYMVLLKQHSSHPAIITPPLKDGLCTSVIILTFIGYLSIIQTYMSSMFMISLFTSDLLESLNKTPFLSLRGGLIIIFHDFIDHDHHWSCYRTVDRHSYGITKSDVFLVCLTTIPTRTRVMRVTMTIEYVGYLLLLIYGDKMIYQITYL